MTTTRQNINCDLPPPPCSATPELVTAPASAQQDQAANEVQASTSVALDPSQPVTNIQIRLADGGRLVQKFNHTHRWLWQRLVFLHVYCAISNSWKWHLCWVFPPFLNPKCIISSVPDKTPRAATDGREINLCLCHCSSCLQTSKVKGKVNKSENHTVLHPNGTCRCFQPCPALKIT